MKKIIAALLSILLVLSVTGCQGSGEVPQEETDEITLTTLAYDTFESTELKEIAEKYEEETGIKVNINVTHYTGDDVAEAYRQQTTTELMAKQGADIYGLNFLDYHTLGEQGLLYDFSSMMEEDEYLNDEHVYMDMIQATSPDGHIYGLPGTFMYYIMLAKTKEMADEMSKEKYTWPEFIEKARSLVQTDLLINIPDTSILREWVMDSWDEIVDENDLENPIDLEVYGKMLEQVKEWREEGVCYNILDPNLPNIIAKANDAMFSMTPISYETLILLNDEEAVQEIKQNYTFRNFSYLIPMPTNNTEDTDVHSIVEDIYEYDVYGINNSSRHKKEAAAFIKYMMQHSEDQEEVVFSIDRATTEKKIRETFEAFEEEVKAGINIDEWVEKSLQYIDSIEFIPKQNGILATECICGGAEAHQYLTGEKGLEETLKEIQEKTILYLKEQN